MKLFVFLTLSFCLSAQEYTHSKKGTNPQELLSCTQPLAEWVAAIHGVANTSGDKQAQLYADVLGNSICAVLSDELGPSQRAVKYTALPKYKDKPWIGVVFVNSKTPVPPGAWAEHIRKSNNFAEYMYGLKTIMFRNDLKQAPLFKGLIAEHEMQHWWQDIHPVPKTIPDLESFKELDAYEFEVALLDKQKLPGLAELVSAERARIRPRIRADLGFLTDFGNPMLDKVFGPFPSPVGKMNAATIIMIKALFAELDSLYAPPEALQRKLAFIHSLYKK